MSAVDNHSTLATAALIAEAKSDTLHRLLTPVSVAGASVNEILARAALLLMERGEVSTFQVATCLLEQSDEIEVLTLRGIGGKR